MTRTPRPTNPIRWRNLLLASAAAGTAISGVSDPGMAQSADFGPEKLWLAAGDAAEGGEGGEGGAPETASADAAYLIELGKLEAHLLAAGRLFATGATDEATALASHPEAEFMDELRARMAKSDVEDRVSGATAALVDALIEGDLAQIASKLEAALAEIRTAEIQGTGGLKPRFDAITQLAKGAAAEFGRGVQDGRVTDMTAIEEGRGFLGAARTLAAPLAGSAAADKVLALIDGALAEAFVDGMSEETAADPSILYGAAARIEIAALSVR